MADYRMHRSGRSYRRTESEQDGSSNAAMGDLPVSESEQGGSSNAAMPYRNKTVQLPHKVDVVAYNAYDHLMGDTYAVAGGTILSSFVVTANEAIKLNPTYYSDSDDQESFYALCWAYKKKKYKRKYTDYILAGGSKGVIRVINSENFLLDMTLQGHHTNTVTDLRCHKWALSLVLSATNENICLWSIITGACLQKVDFDEVHSAVDFHFINRYLILSSGPEKSVRLWYMTGCWKKNWLRKKNVTTKELSKYGPAQQLNIEGQVHFLRCLEKSVLTHDGENEMVLSSYLRYGLYPSERKVIQRITAYCKPSKFETNNFSALAVGNELGDIDIWTFAQPRSSRLLARLSDPDGLPVIHTAISNSKKTMVSINNQGKATVWIEKVLS